MLVMCLEESSIMHILYFVKGMFLLTATALKHSRDFTHVVATSVPILGSCKI